MEINDNHFSMIALEKLVPEIVIFMMKKQKRKLITSEFNFY